MPLPIWPAPMMPTDLMVETASDSEPLRGRSTGPPDFLALRPASMTPCSFNTPVDLCASCCRSSLGLFQFGPHLRQNLEQVADHAIVRNLEDRGFAILVDGNDDPAVLHPGQVLDGARYADGNVE